MKMKGLMFLLLWSLLLAACNSNTSATSNTERNSETTFVSTQVDGKWTVDRATAEELKGMKNTIENFTLLNKKKFENLAAYQEYGILLENHINRVNTYCLLDPKTKNTLCANLNRIKEQMEILKGNDMEKSREAIKTINAIYSEIDSSFNYNN
jgi:hypothetical protein